jgi:hypothetical protein
MSTVSVSSFGSLEPSAQRLIESARALVSPGQDLDVLHVLLASIPADAPDASGSEAIDGSVVAALLTKAVDLNLVRALVRVELKLHAGQNSSAGITDALLRAANFWRNVSIRSNARVTDAVVMWGVLADDNIASHILHEAHADLSALLHDLERHFDLILPNLGRQEYKIGPRVVPPTIPPDKRDAYLVAAEMTRTVQPTNGFHYAGMHAILLSNTLDVLGSCSPPQFAVLEGRNGSPLRYVGQVIADRIASGEQFTEQRERLRQCRAVYLLNLESIIQLAAKPDEPDPWDVLEMTVEQADEDRAVLLLDHIELLGAHGDTERKLLAQLSDPGDTLILGLYELKERGDPGVERTLGLHDVRQILARDYTPAQTKALLFDFYVPQWETRGFTFAPDAFDAVIALEPGAWIELRRKTLPYLVVGLAADAVQMIRDGVHLIRDVAHRALDALEDLKQERATSDEHIREQFDPVLAMAREEIQSLIAEPVTMDQSKYRVTRAHMLAQLICPNASEFHYPGHIPKELHIYPLEDLPLDGEM